MSAPRVADLERAADLIADWGFLAHPGTGGRMGPGYLITAIREHPTLDHFDPESVRFWVTELDRGAHMALDSTSPVPWEHELSWGTIRLVDRLGVSNEYLTFGGVVAADRVDGTTVVIFLSPAPLLRRGGHSQGWDLGAPSVGAYFGRLLAAVGSSREVELLAARADPLTRYAAFLVDAATRRRTDRPGVDADPAEARFFRSEAVRLGQADAAHWRGGQELARSTAAASGAGR